MARIITIHQNNGLCALQIPFAVLLKLVRTARKKKMPLDGLVGLEVSPHQSNMVSKVPCDMKPPRLLSMKERVNEAHRRVVRVECILPADTWLHNGFSAIREVRIGNLIVKGVPAPYEVKSGEGLTIKGLSLEQKKALEALLANNQ